MHYKIFSFLFLITIGFNQSFYYKSVGNDVFSHSPRSLGLGYNLGLGAKDGFALNGNPANLINKEKEITVYLNSNYEGVSERRSFILKDSFGDFLTDADYNMNSNRVFNYSTGITYNSKISNNLFSIGVNYSPILDFNSKFREEVRGSLSCDEGIPCTRDVLSGYHNFSTDGTIYGISTGGATEITTKFGAIKLGLSLLNTLNSELNYNFSVDTLLNDWSNLSKILPHQNKVDIASNKSTNFGILFESKYGIDLSYFYHNSIDFEVKDEFPFGFISEESGLIEYIYDCNDFECENGDSLFSIFNTKGSFQLPQKTGLSIVLTPLTYQKTSVFFEYVKNKFKNPSLIFSNNFIKSSLDSTKLVTPNYTLSSFNKFKFGIEYLTLSNSFIRTGFSYNESPIPGINSQSIISVGYGKNIDNLNFNIGISYKYYNYNYPDIFPVKNDPRPDYDTVKESIFNISTSIQYSL